MFMLFHQQVKSKKMVYQEDNLNANDPHVSIIYFSKIPLSCSRSCESGQRGLPGRMQTSPNVSFFFQNPALLCTHVWKNEKTKSKKNALLQCMHVQCSHMNERKNKKTKWYIIHKNFPKVHFNVFILNLFQITLAAD